MCDWIGWILVMHGPFRLTCNAGTKFGSWCLRRAGGHAYKDRRTTAREE